jgi:hypothetical protein
MFLHVAFEIEDSFKKENHGIDIFHQMAARSQAIG